MRQLKSYRYVIKGEPRALMRAGDHNDKREWTNYKNDRVNIILELEQQNIDRKNLSGPLHLDVEFLFPAPPKKNITGYYYDLKPDINYLIRFILDVCDGVLYPNNCMISLITAKKNYAKEASTIFILEEIRS